MMMLWHSLVVECGSPNVWDEDGLLTNCMGLCSCSVISCEHLTFSLLCAAFERHSSPPSVCLRKTHKPNPVHALKDGKLFFFFKQSLL